MNRGINFQNDGGGGDFGWAMASPFPFLGSVHGSNVDEILNFSIFEIAK